MAEQKAFNNFISKIDEIYKFQFNQLEDAIAVCRLINTDLLLCILNQSDDYGIALKDGSKIASNVGNKYINIVLWDISDKSLRGPLVNICNENLQCPEVVNAINDNISSIFIIGFNPSPVLKTVIQDSKQEIIDDDMDHITPAQDLEYFKATDFCTNIYENFDSAFWIAVSKEMPLLVYLHNSEDIFSKMFNNLIVEHNTGSLFTNFSIYVVDVNDKIEEKCKQNALSLVHHYYEIKKSGLFVYHTINAQLKLHTFFDTTIKDDGMFIFELNKIISSVQEDYLKLHKSLEKQGIEAFISNYEHKFGDFHPEFLDKHLGNIINDCVSIEPEYLQKCLVLYLHSANSNLSDSFTELLGNIDLVHHLKYFSFVAWDIDDPSRHKTQVHLLKKYFNLNIFKEFIEQNSSGIFFFLPTKGEPQLFSYFSDKLEYEHLMINIAAIEDHLTKSNGITNFIELRANETTKIDRCCPSLKVSLFDLIKDKYLNCQNTNERKMLLMYFYKENTPVTKSFDQLLCERPELVTMINEKFHFLAWDVSRKDLVKYLELAIERNFKDKNMTKLLREGVPGLFVFMPIAECLTLFKFIPYDASASDITNTLKECAENFTTELEIELHLQNNFTNIRDKMKPETLHQIMYDNMANRDYDCFELDRENHAKYLFQKVAYAYFGPPKNDIILYNETQTSIVNDMIEVIKTQCLMYTHNPNLVVFTCIYNITTPLPAEKLEKCKKDGDYNPCTDFNAKPIFVVPKCTEVEIGCRTFIDTDLRVYSNWEAYLEENKLGKCICVTPKDGRYQGDCWNRVLLEYNPSPACGLGIQVLNTIDIAAMVVGLSAGAVGLVALIPAAIVAAPILVPISIVSGTVVSIYTLVRSGNSLYDRFSHQQTMSFMDSEARGAYLNITAGALGFAGTGARLALTTFVSTGGNVGFAIRGAVNGLTGANVLISGVAIGNSTYEVFNQWQSNNEVSYLTLIQLSSSILFFGHSVYNMQSAGTIITETQQQTLEDISATLRSNRHRKTFMKLTKESVAIHGDQQGKAKVIAYIKNVGSSRDDMLANLTRNNRMLNQKGIRYFVDEGQVQFNNVKVDIGSLGNGPRHQQSANRLNLTMNGDKNFMRSSQMYSTVAFNVLECMPKVCKIMQEADSMKTAFRSLFRLFNSYVVEKLIILVPSLLGLTWLNQSLLQIYPSAQLPFKVLKRIIGFFTKMAEDRMAAEGIDSSQWGYKLIHYIELSITMASMSLVDIIRKLADYISEYILHKIITAADTTSSDRLGTENRLNNDNRIKCTTCAGFFYNI